MFPSLVFPQCIYVFYGPPVSPHGIDLLGVGFCTHCIFLYVIKNPIVFLRQYSSWFVVFWWTGIRVCCVYVFLPGKLMRCVATMCTLERKEGKQFILGKQTSLFWKVYALVPCMGSRSKHHILISPRLSLERSRNFYPFQWKRLQVKSL